MECTRSSVCKYWRWPKTFESRWRIGSLHIFCLISCYHVSNNRMLQYKESSNWLVWHTFFVTQLFKYMTCRDEWSRHVAPCPPGKTPSFASKSSTCTSVSFRRISATASKRGPGSRSSRRKTPSETRSACSCIDSRRIAGFMPLGSGEIPP
jgi:hypothetical protein